MEAQAVRHGQRLRQQTSKEERLIKQETETEILERKTEHALAQWSTRPCKPKAQQTVSGVHQHPGQDGGVWIKHIWMKNTLLRGQPGQDEQSRNSTTELYLCVGMPVCEFLFKDTIIKKLFEAFHNFTETACGQHMACV